MKMVDLGFGAVAIEPDSSRLDTVSDLDISALRNVGISEQAIKIYERFGRGHDLGPAAGSPSASGLTNFSRDPDMSDL